MQYYIGIDADGTTIRMKLADKNSKVLGEYSGPGYTITSSSFDQVYAAFNKLISAALNEHSLNPVDCICISIGAAGVDTSELRSQYTRIFEMIGFRRASIMVFNDCELLTQAYPMQACVAVIAEIGSIIVGKDELGRIVRYSGWSFLVSDEGSSAYIALEAIKHVIKFLDGYGDCSILSKLLQDQLDLYSPYEIANYVHENLSYKANIGKLALVVQKAADENDSTAKEILHRAAEELYKGVSTVALEICGSKEKALSIVMCGSVLIKNNYVADRFKQLMQTAFPKAVLTIPNDNALDCALKTAMKKL